MLADSPPPATETPSPAQVQSRPVTTRRATNLYRVVWRWHFYAGVIVAPVLVVMAATGALYIFKDEAERLIHADLMFVTPGASRASYDAQAAAAVANSPPGFVVRQLVASSDPERATAIGGQRDGEFHQLFVDPWLRVCRDQKRSQQDLPAAAKVAVFGGERTSAARRGHCRGGRKAAGLYALGNDSTRPRRRVCRVWKQPDRTFERRIRGHRSRHWRSALASSDQSIFGVELVEDMELSIARGIDPWVADKDSLVADMLRSDATSGHGDLDVVAPPASRTNRVPSPPPGAHSAGPLGIDRGDVARPADAGGLDIADRGGRSCGCKNHAPAGTPTRA